MDIWIMRRHSFQVNDASKQHLHNLQRAALIPAWQSRFREARRMGQDPGSEAGKSVGLWIRVASPQVVGATDRISASLPSD